MKKIFFCFILVSHSLVAQWGDQTYLVEYKKAVQLYANAQYDLASVKFNLLCDKKYTNPVVPYAYFYNALNSKSKGSGYQSRVTFRQLFELFPEWENINDARIIYADLNFKDEFYIEGFKQMDLVYDKNYKSLKDQISNAYIPKLSNLVILKDLHVKFPEEKSIAQRIVEVVAKNRYSSKADLELSDNLTNRFKLNLKKSDTKPRPKPSTDLLAEKRSINMGLLLPFDINENTINVGQNRYIYEFYKGMQIANTHLAAQKIAINISAFDVSKDRLDFQMAERNKGFKNLDVVIGPLYSGSNSLAEVFSENNRVIQVHPFSNNKSLLENNVYAVMAQASASLQATEGLTYLKKQNKTKSISIYFGGNKKDSLSAVNFKQEATKAGFIVNYTGLFDGKIIKGQAEKGFVYFTGSENVLSRFISIYQSKNYTAPILANIPGTQLETVVKAISSANVSIICTDYVDVKKDNVRIFQKEFFEKMNVMPSYYAYLGYDLARYFAMMLKDGRDIYKLNIEAGPYTEDLLLSGFDFSKKIKENNIVPILKFNGSEFIVTD